jgi:hypothetical protein
MTFLLWQEFIPSNVSAKLDGLGKFLSVFCMIINTGQKVRRIKRRTWPRFSPDKNFQLYSKLPHTSTQHFCGLAEKYKL